METEAPRPARGLLLRVFWSLLIVALIGYPLSLGPVIYFDVSRSGTLRPAAWRTFYVPLIWAVGNIPGVERPMNAYIQFWCRLGVLHRVSQPPEAVEIPSADF